MEGKQESGNKERFAFFIFALSSDSPLLPNF
jgi:hypothetical protein